MDKIELIKRIISDALVYEQSDAGYLQGVMSAIETVCKLGEDDHGEEK